MTPAEPGGGIMTATPVEHVAPPAPVSSPRPSLWPAALRSRERRLWSIALTATILVAALGIGLLYADDTSNQAAVRALQLRNESLTGRTQNLNDQLTRTQSNLTATLGELATTKAELAHPHLVLWNLPQNLADSSAYLVGGIPDTFTYHLQATSTGPMDVSILTMEQFVSATNCVNLGRGPTDYCMHHSGVVQSWLGVTSVSYDFHLAEGCADYVSAFTAPSKVTVTPNVTVTYNPAVNATGACAA